MKNKKLNDEIELTQSMRVLAESYQEISVRRMQKIRGGIVSARDFMERLSQIFIDVHTSYQSKLLSAAKAGAKPVFPLPLKNERFTFSTSKKNGKMVLVLVSATARLYGSIVSQVFQSFLLAVNKYPQADIIILGAVGKQLFDGLKKERQYQFFELADVATSLEQIQPVITVLLDYQDVQIYFGKFNNIMIQSPAVSDLSGSLPTEEVGLIEERKEFFFEPIVEKIVDYFGNQAFASLFKQTVHEGELARFASRVSAMENALINIDKAQDKLHTMVRSAKKVSDNNKRIGALAGMSLWR